MRNSSIAAAVVSAALIPSLGYAQTCFDSNVGTPLGAGDETVSAAQPLGFSFTWPDGTISTDAVATSNGRISYGASGIVPTFVTDGPTFTSDPSSIAAVWTDLDFGAAISGDVDFFADPGGAFATFTYRDAVVFGGTAQFSFQVQLNADSSFVLRTSPGIAQALVTGTFAVTTVVGWTAGPLVGDPGTTDFSASGGTFDTLTVATAYDGAAFDLESAEIQVFPNGIGGYVAIVGGCGFASTTNLFAGCNQLQPPEPKIGIRWIPSGGGAYASFADPTLTFDPAFGPSIGADLDSITNVALGFPFAMPGGTVVTSLNVDSNGRVLLPTSGSASLFSPMVADMEAEEQIAVHWADWITAEAGGSGTIHFTTDGVGRALITWFDVEPFGVPTTTGCFQLELLGGGGVGVDNWAVCYQRTNLDPATSNVMIGGSDGMLGALEIDLVPGPGGSAGGGHWEFFDAGVPEVYDLQPLPPTGSVRSELTALTPPAVGTSFDLQLDNIPAGAAFGVLSIGLLNLNAPLSIIDPTNPCFLLSSLDLVTIPITVGPPTFNASLNLNGASALMGVSLILQGVIADLSQPYAIPVITSNGLEAVIGG